MVGVPNSKGCKTCIQRKLKCDQEKPNCNRCMRTRRQCGGYEKQTLWRNSFAPQSSAPSPASSCLPLSGDKASATVITLHNPKTYNLPQEVRAGPSYSSQFLSLFLNSYMPTGKDNTIPSPGKLPLIVWPHRLPGIIGRSVVVDSAVDAMVSSYLGLVNKDMRLMKQSIPLYAIAIRKVYNATTKIQYGVTEDILSAIMAMAMFEMFLATGTGWMSHVQGGATLLQRRGPPTLDNPINKDLLRRFRSLTICDCIGRRKASFFEQAQWQSLNGPHPYDDLLDIISSVPRVLENVDNLQVSPTTFDKSKTLNALYHCLELEQRLQAWNTALSNSADDAAFYWKEQIPNDPEDDAQFANLFPCQLRFRELWLAQLHQLYWAATNQIYAAMEELLLTYERIRRLHPLNPSLLVPSLPPPDSPINRSITEISALATYYADLCCAAQRYICSAEMGAVGPQSTLAAIGMVKMFYESHDELKLRWCRRELSRLSERGFGAAKLLRELNRDGYANFGKGSTWTGCVEKDPNGQQQTSATE